MSATRIQILQRTSWFAALGILNWCAGCGDPEPAAFVGPPFVEPPPPARTVSFPPEAIPGWRVRLLGDGVSRRWRDAAGETTVPHGARLELEISLGLGVEPAAAIPPLGDLERGSIDALSIWGWNEIALTESEWDEVASLQTLSELGLRRIQWTSGAAKAISALTSLEALTLSHTGVTDEAMEGLAPLENLEILTIAGEKLRGEGLRHLAPAPRLKRLRLLGVPINSAGLEAIGRFEALEELWMEPEGRSSASVGFSDDALAHLAGLTRLRSLRFTNRSMNGSGLRHLAGLGALEELDLGSTRVANEKYLERLTELTALRHLSIRNLGITDRGMEHLSRLTNLETLDFSAGSVLCDESIQKLGALELLKEVSIGRNRLSGSALISYSDPLPLHDHREFTHQGIQKLRRALPDCKIRVTPEFVKPPSPTPRRPIG